MRAGAYLVHPPPPRHFSKSENFGFDSSCVLPCWFGAGKLQTMTAKNKRHRLHENLKQQYYCPINHTAHPKMPPKGRLVSAYLTTKMAPRFRFADRPGSSTTSLTKRRTRGSACSLCAGSCQTRHGKKGMFQGTFLRSCGPVREGGRLPSTT